MASATNRHSAEVLEAAMCQGPVDLLPRLGSHPVSTKRAAVLPAGDEPGRVLAEVYNKPCTYVLRAITLIRETGDIGYFIRVYHQGYWGGFQDYGPWSMPTGAGLTDEERDVVGDLLTQRLTDLLQNEVDGV